MPIAKIKLDLVLMPHEMQQLRLRLGQLMRSDDRILVQISDTTDPIRGWNTAIVGHPMPSEYAVELRASSPSQIETVCDLIAEFGTLQQQDKRNAVEILSRVAKEANVEAGFPESATDVVKALKAAVEHGGSTWHGLIRKKLRAWIRTNSG
jgi:hypothetical protein